MEWKWFRREIDIVIGIEAQFEDGEKELIPLMAIELKMGGPRFFTDELAKKSAIYGSLKEMYPWVHTVLIAYSFRENLGGPSILRNARQFDTIAKPEWEKTTQKMLKKLIDQQLEYLLKYWEL